MPRASHPPLLKPPRRGFPRAYPRVPAIISVGLVAALLVALGVAGFYLSAELADSATFEEGADPETLAMSGAVALLIVGFTLLLVHLLRKGLAAGRERKQQPVVPF